MTFELRLERARKSPWILEGRVFQTKDSKYRGPDILMCLEELRGCPCPGGRAEGRVVGEIRRVMNVLHREVS